MLNPNLVAPSSVRPCWCDSTTSLPSWRACTACVSSKPWPEGMILNRLGARMHRINLGLISVALHLIFLHNQKKQLQNWEKLIYLSHLLLSVSPIIRSVSRKHLTLTSTATPTGKDQAATPISSHQHQAVGKLIPLSAPIDLSGRAGAYRQGLDGHG